MYVALHAPYMLNQNFAEQEVQAKPALTDGATALMKTSQEPDLAKTRLGEMVKDTMRDVVSLAHQENEQKQQQNTEKPGVKKTQASVAY